jgi:hypothetical protein
MTRPNRQETPRKRKDISKSHLVFYLSSGGIQLYLYFETRVNCNSPIKTGFIVFEPLPLYLVKFVLFGDGHTIYIKHNT